MRIIYPTICCKRLKHIGFICFLLMLGGCGSEAPNSTSSSISSTSSSSNSISSSSSSSSSLSGQVDTSAYQDGEHILGMDISYWSEQLDRGVTYIDTDGQAKDLLDLFKNHGINFIRLRIFVDPLAAYGYSSSNSCPGRSQAYNGKEDIVGVAQKIKSAGMGFLLDFHYSDTWADPGKQLIPEAWRDVKTHEDLAARVHDYTKDVLDNLAQVNALPNMVQIGNETTPGMLRDIPSNTSDCWGNNAYRSSGPTGEASDANWPNLAKLFAAGIKAVNTFDPSIKVMLHVESTDRPNDVVWWANSALQQGVKFDVLGLSAYEEFQGPASQWRSTMQRLSADLPSLEFAFVEYNPQARLLNDIMSELPGGRGLGTFFWEPTESGFWGSAIFTLSGNVYRANEKDFAIYDQIVEDYGLRKLPQGQLR